MTLNISSELGGAGESGEAMQRVKAARPLGVVLILDTDYVFGSCR